MITKYCVLILVFLSAFIFGQLKLDVTLVDSTVKVTIFNESKERYVLPLDKTHLRPYEKNCNAFLDYESEFPSLGLMINMIDSTGKNEEYTIGYKYVDKIDSIRKRWILRGMHLGKR